MIEPVILEDLEYLLKIKADTENYLKSLEFQINILKNKIMQESNQNLTQING